MIEVVRAGALTTVQDQGRIGWAHLGVPRSGALDQPALCHANQLVGNIATAAGLETTLTGCVLRPQQATTVAVTGATAVVTVDDQVTATGTAFRVPAGALLVIGPARAGVRSYLAVRGGIDVPTVLGSRSTDTLSGLGPAPLRRADRLPIGSEINTESQPPARRAEQATVSEEIVLHMRFGPRDEWFTATARDRLCTNAYTVTTRSNRVGARLSGGPLTRANLAELPSEGIVLGAIQVTPDGAPLVFLADHPTTGGYPVIAVVDPADLPLLAQARPGATVRFHGSQR